jgi:hypothetical protein
MQPMMMALANQVERQRHYERQMLHVRSEAIASRSQSLISQGAVSRFPRRLIPACRAVIAPSNTERVRI